MLHFMDSNGTIVGDLATWIQQKKLNNYENLYSVTAILGPQSSGKSTLLNQLYGTDFSIMNHEFGHSRTTQGIWMALSDESDNTVTIVLDVEGTDSKEGNQDNLTFERRTALLCLALSDCLVINTSYQSLGNFVASNYNILKTIMEANLELFQLDDNSSKTTLLFTIRDWTRHNNLVTPLAVIEDEIKSKYIGDIWNKIHKPSQYANSDVTEFFNIMVVGIGHPIFHPEEFKESIVELKQLWSTKIKPKTYSRNVPIDSWAAYCESIWKRIIENRELDIPSITDMISITKCREIMAMVLSQTQKDFDRQLKISSATEMKNFVEWAQTLIINCIAAYTEGTSRHKPKCAKEIQFELIAALLSQIEKVANFQFGHIANKIFNKYSTKIKNYFMETTTVDEHPKDNDPLLTKWASFGEYRDKMMSSMLDEFNEIVLNHSITFYGEHQNFNATEATQKLERLMGDLFTKLNEKFLDTFNKTIQVKIFSDLKPLKQFIHNEDSEAKDFWPHVNTQIESLSEKYKSKYWAAWMGLQSNLTTDLTFNDFHSFCKTCAIFELIKLIATIHDQAESIAMDKFKSLFVPPENTKWTDVSKEKVQEIFSTAQKKTNAWISTWDQFEISFEKTNLNNEKIKNIEKKVKSFSNKEKTMEHFLTQSQEQLTYILTLREKNISGWSSIPIMFWVLLFILGFDEMVTFFKFFFSAYFILFIAIAGAIYMFHSQLEQMIGAPYVTLLINILKTLISNLFKFIKNSLPND